MNDYLLIQAYLNFLSVIANMLRQSGTRLGLMAPGYPEQLALNNGKDVDVAPNGIPIVYRAVVRRRSNVFRSQREFGIELQAALDETCYQACLTRLLLVGVTDLPGNRVGLEVIETTW